MLSTILASLVPVILLFVGLLCLLLPLWHWKRAQSTHERESPLTKNMIRPPGYTLGKKVDGLNEDISFHLMFLMAIPLLLFSLHVSQSYFADEPESFLRIATSGLTGLGMVVFIGYRLRRYLEECRRLRLGHEGEMFTGEELNRLMLEGCRVFHDIQFPYGNIDHVVVSRSGVYSVNTKMRGKPKVGEGRAEVVVDHPKGMIRFPDWNYEIPLRQLETEAKWLSQHLGSATGMTIRVEPILAIPGWYIKDRIGRGSVFVINPQNPKKFFVQKRLLFDEDQVQRIAHQLEQMCRDVEPSFRDQKSWNGSGAGTSTAKG